jgi:hypothetical protein
MKKTHGVPEELVGPANVYAKLIPIKNNTLFIKNFLDVLQITTSGSLSPFWLPPLWWGEGMHRVGSVLAQHLQMMENGLNHCSIILAGMKGVGKTSM